MLFGFIRPSKERTMIRKLVGVTAMTAWVGFSAIAPALAAPPTVVPSPGYDRRLVESRRALGSSYHDERLVVVPREHRHHDRSHGRHRHPR
jgi:hypothetical protein